MVLDSKCELKAKQKEIIIIPGNIQQAAPMGNRRLLLSDNPEVLNEESFIEDSVVLWHDCVNTQGKVSHRVYGWHVNKTGKNVKVGVTLENLCKSNTLTIHNLKRDVRLTAFSNFYITHVGRPLARACLSNALTKVNPLDKQIKARIGLVEEYSLPKGSLIGFIQEFEVSADSNDLNYIIRVVASKDSNSDLRTITSCLAKDDGLHYRGSWEYADIYGQAQTYKVNEILAISISNGYTDNLQTSANSFDSTNATHNPGHYGSYYKVRIPVFNQNNGIRTVLVGVNPRGGGYAGAVKLPLGVFNIPLLIPNETNFANVMYYRAPVGLSYLELTFMHAGAGSLPLAIYLETI